MTKQTSRLAIVISSTRAKNNADSLTSALLNMTRAGENAAKRPSFTTGCMTTRCARRKKQTGYFWMR